MSTPAPSRRAGRRSRGHRPTVLPVGAPLPQDLLRLRGGTYSPTVSRLQFTDGTSARADLIPLTPDVDAYSVQFSGVSPPQRAQYRAQRWFDGIAALGADPHAARLARVEGDVATLIASSYPAIDLTELSARVRAAGLPLDHHDLREHEAIAATQAAIWNRTDALDLEQRSLTHAATVEHWDGSRRRDLPVGRLGIGRALLSGHARQSITLTLPQAPTLDSYSFRIAPTSGRLDGVVVHLETSPDGVLWHPVPSSRVRLDRSARPTYDGWHVTKGLGSGATVRRSIGSRHIGYPFYRLVVWGAGPGTLSDLTLVAASGEAGNSEAVVSLYSYLLRRLETPGARRDGRAALLLGSSVRGGTPEFTTLALAIAVGVPTPAPAHRPGQSLSTGYPASTHAPTPPATLLTF